MAASRDDADDEAAALAATDWEDGAKADAPQARAERRASFIMVLVSCMTCKIGLSKDIRSCGCVGMSSLGDKSSASSDMCCISSTSFGILFFYC